MVAFTPELAGNTIVVMIIVYFIALIYSIYMAYVGWRQAKVYNQMEQVIKLLKQIRDKK